MNILALAAHPDDVEFQCAGTLILLGQHGHALTIADLHNGSCGSATRTPEEIARLRAGEARRAAALIGADYVNAGVPDLESVFDNPTRRQVAELVRRAQPGIILTHYPEDYLADHTLTSALARDAAFTATLGNYPTGAPAPAPKLAHVPHLYHFAPTEGTDNWGRPVHFDFIVDVTPVMDRKVEMLCCHASQREWLRVQHGIDEYVEFLKREAATLGRLAGCAFGEGFRQHRGSAYPRDNILASLLGESLRPVAGRPAG